MAGFLKVTLETKPAISEHGRAFNSKNSSLPEISSSSTYNHYFNSF